MSPSSRRSVRTGSIRTILTCGAERKLKSGRVLRVAGVPLCGLLVGVRQFQHFHLAERWPDEFDADGQVVFKSATRGDIGQRRDIAHVGEMARTSFGRAASTPNSARTAVVVGNETGWRG